MSLPRLSTKSCADGAPAGEVWAKATEANTGEVVEHGRQIIADYCEGDVVNTYAGAPPPEENIGRISQRFVARFT